MAGNGLALFEEAAHQLGADVHGVGGRPAIAADQQLVPGREPFHE